MRSHFYERKPVGFKLILKTFGVETAFRVCGNTPEFDERQGLDPEDDIEFFVQGDGDWFLAEETVKFESGGTTRIDLSVSMSEDRRRGPPSPVRPAR